jgi:hypothetical protein
VDRAVDRVMRSAQVAALAAALMGAASCYTKTNGPCGVVPPPRLVLLDPMPDDFSVGLWTWEGNTPRTQLDVEVSADGQGSWRVWVPETKREIVRGTYRADAAKVASAWRAVVGAKFDKIDAGKGFTAGRSDCASGIERFAVSADGAERYVWRPCGATDVAEIHESVLATLPPETRAAFGR